MSGAGPAPRLEIDLDRITDNARRLRERLGERGIAVTAVLKATLGSPEIARAVLRGGVRRLADSRIENIEAFRAAGIRAPFTLTRSPMSSQVERVVRHVDTSCNTELEVIDALSREAGRQGRPHRVLLMVELGDLREGVLPAALPSLVRAVRRLPNLVLAGIGTNLACRSGVVPDAANMGELSALADAIDREHAGEGGPVCARVSGGNSANVGWALGGGASGRINDLRLGEALLLGRDPLDRSAIDGLHTDAFRLVAEVIESAEKPSLPRGTIAQNAAGDVPVHRDRGPVRQAILALGLQDTEPDDLDTSPGIVLSGASGDHLVVETERGQLSVGDELTFAPGYGALLRAMTSPFVARRFIGGDVSTVTDTTADPSGPGAHTRRDGCSFWTSRTPSA